MEMGFRVILSGNNSCAVTLLLDNQRIRNYVSLINEDLMHIMLSAHFFQNMLKL